MPVAVCKKEGVTNRSWASVGFVGHGHVLRCKMLGESTAREMLHPSSMLLSRCKGRNPTRWSSFRRGDVKVSVEASLDPTDASVSDGTTVRMRAYKNELESSSDKRGASFRVCVQARYAGGEEVCTVHRTCTEPYLSRPFLHIAHTQQNTTKQKHTGCAKNVGGALASLHRRIFLCGAHKKKKCRCDTCCPVAESFKSRGATCRDRSGDGRRTGRERRLRKLSTSIRWRRWPPVLNREGEV